MDYAHEHIHKQIKHTVYMNRLAK